ncbi:hypothetical protein B0A48_02659 [Cryoendolithus antarcticus]|uniref:BTB domain-containing protein n=1 Tax=Cryoendolithus antarcticus TaxID=1507870 RepID=A0A1V8TKW2_9PEZI|nr:hypothetical protein B0A48_02659 [Cryoendolithus antarcticus]
MGRLKKVVRHHLPIQPREMSEQRVTRSTLSPELGASRSNGKKTPKRRRRKPPPPTEDSDVEEIAEESSKIRPKRPRAVMRRRRSPIDAAPKLGTHVLFLFVGPDRIVTTLHTNLLGFSTITALQELYQEGFIVLESHSPESVELYRMWLYTGRLFTSVPDEEETTAEELVLADREWGRLANAYMVGVDLRDEKFANLIVDAMIEKVDGSEFYPTSLATSLYTHMPWGDKMCHLIVDFHVWKGLGTGIEIPHEDAVGPQQFIFEVQRGLKAANGMNSDPRIVEPWRVDRCRYHVHL